VKIKKILRLIFILLSVSCVFLLVTKYGYYYEKKNYAKIILIVVLFLFISLGACSLRLTKFSFVSLIYIVLSLYTLNFLFLMVDLYKDKNKFKNTFINKDKIDNRSLIEFVNNENYNENKILPYIVPREYLGKNNYEEIPLTPLSNTYFAKCNEYGVWKTFKTDKFGFNNIKFKKTFNVLLMGDSFAEGDCVDDRFEISNYFTDNYMLPTYNIGVAGNGPLLSLAQAHEVKKYVNFDTIVWLIYDNDFYDLKLELKSKYLTNYLNEDFIDNRYFERLNKFEIFQTKFINDNIKNYKTGFSFKENFFELKSLISIMNKILNRNNQYAHDNFLNKEFKKIFNKLEYIYPDKNIYIVYLPETSCFSHRKKDCYEKFNILQNMSEKIKFLNFYEYLNSIEENYKNFYALGKKKSHYSPKGYKYLSKFIFENITSDL
jgi:hypothetical protein